MGKKDVPKGFKVIFRPWITKNGRRLHARTFGLRAWRLLVRE